MLFLDYSSNKHKAIPETGCGGPQDCKILRFEHFLDNRLTRGKEAVSLMHWLPFNPG
jgi:hypothetical protein